MNYSIQTVQTKSIDGQKPGTSGLRKSVKCFQQKNYTENYIQSVLTSLGDGREESVLVIGGDGRYYVKDAIKKIIQIAAGNKVSKLLIGQNGILSTPAVSCIIRKLSLTGGIVLTASHNPGGPNADFGIKFNTANGGPANDTVSNKIYEITKKITEYYIAPDIVVDLSKIGKNIFVVEGKVFLVEVIDPVADYLELMKSIFDFEKIKLLIQGDGNRKPFKLLISSMNGVTGPYVNKIFIEEFGADPSNVINTMPLEDFGGIHPDPNLTYAADLVEMLKQGDYDFGAAFDGDGDRNMILGDKAFFVNPSDSLAVLSDHLLDIPYYQKTGVRGYARSMPTSSSVDRVAEAKQRKIYEVPTGWKYFGNLMDAHKISICGEESFGTGSDHMREKDGIWTALAWLSIIQTLGLSVRDILENHWKKYGRNYFMRYDYENCDASKCNEMMKQLEANITSPEFVGTEYEQDGIIYKVVYGDNYKYTDPVDGVTSTNHGLRIIFENESRIIFRLSGTGTTGATVRIYFESVEKDFKNACPDPQEKLSSLVKIALKISKLESFTGMDKPTVIT